MIPKKLSWIPVKNAVHKNFSDLVAIRGHRNFYGNLLSGKITFRKGKMKIPTPHTTIRDAKEFVDVRIELDRNGKSEDQVKRERMGVGSPLMSEVWSEMVASKKIESKPATIVKYESNWRNAIQPFWANIAASQINDDTILRFKDWYLTEFPTRYFGHTENHVVLLLKFALKKKYINKMPDVSALANVDEATSRNSRRQWKQASKRFTDKEVDLLIEMAGTLRRPDKKALATLGIMLAAKCGLRKMEAMMLRWDEGEGQSWVNLESKIMRVWSDKNSRWRIVPIPKSVMEAFQIQKQFTDSVWVFPMPSDPTRHISSQVFDKVWFKCRSLAGVTGRYHDLRHTFATKTAEDGWPPVVACEVLDQSLAIYQKTYCKPSQESKTKWMLKTFD